MPTMPPRHRPLGQPTREQAEARRKAFLDRNRPSPAERGYDADWRRCRKLFIAKNMTCCVPDCGKATEEVDHIESVRARPDLRLKWSNLRPYCKPHHSERTAREQSFGRGASASQS
jgi:5-methylcytosine-specific restriction protein A